MACKNKLKSFAVLLLFLATGAAAQQQWDSLAVKKPVYVKEGIASYYANHFNGRRTASGDIYRKNQLTAAHKTLPFGTIVKVTNLKNGRWVFVRINDRGPHHRKRIIDLSYRAAKHLGLVRGSGLMRVRVEEVPEKESTQ